MERLATDAGYPVCETSSFFLSQCGGIEFYFFPPFRTPIICANRPQPLTCSSRDAPSLQETTDKGCEFRSSSQVPVKLDQVNPQISTSLSSFCSQIYHSHSDPRNMLLEVSDHYDQELAGTENSDSGHGAKRLDDVQVLRGNSPAEARCCLHGARVAVWRPALRTWTEGTIMGNSRGGLLTVAFGDCEEPVCCGGSTGPGTFPMPKPVARLEEAFSEAILFSGHPHIKLFVNGSECTSSPSPTLPSSQSSPTAAVVAAPAAQASSVVPFLRAWKPNPAAAAAPVPGSFDAQLAPTEQSPRAASSHVLGHLPISPKPTGSDRRRSSDPRASWSHVASSQSTRNYVQAKTRLVSRLQKDFRGSQWLRKWFDVIHSREASEIGAVIWGQYPGHIPDELIAKETSWLRNAIGVRVC